MNHLVFKTKVINIYYMTSLILGCIYSNENTSVSILIFQDQGSCWKHNQLLGMTVDLDRHGPTRFYVTFLIFSYIHDKEVILGPILSNFWTVLWIQPQLVTWPWRLTLKANDKQTFMTFLIFGCMPYTEKVYMSIFKPLMPKVLQLLQFLTWLSRRYGSS